MFFYFLKDKVYNLNCMYDPIAKGQESFLHISVKQNSILFDCSINFENCELLFGWPALKLLSSAESQKIPKSSLLLVMPVLQILSSTALEDCISVDEEGPSRQQLAVNLLEMVQQERYRDEHQKVITSSLFLLT